MATGPELAERAENEQRKLPSLGSVRAGKRARNAVTKTAGTDRVPLPDNIFVGRKGKLPASAVRKIASMGSQSRITGTFGQKSIDLETFRQQLIEKGKNMPPIESDYYAAIKKKGRDLMFLEAKQRGNIIQKK